MGDDEGRLRARLGPQVRLLLRRVCYFDARLRRRARRVEWFFRVTSFVLRRGVT